MSNKYLEIKDMLGFNVNFELKQQRIISLVPSQTLLLFDLGLGDKVVGKKNFVFIQNLKLKLLEVRRVFILTE